MDEELIVLGFDGMDIHILEEAMEERELPNFERLKEEGVLGTLNSTHPPVTIPAWISMFTGKNPGKLGAFHFQELNRETGRFEPVDVSQYFGSYVWDAGIESALLFVPGTSPPYTIDGLLVEGVPGRKDFRTYPGDLKEEIATEEDISRITNSHEDYAERIMEMYEGRRNVVHRAFENHSQELLIAVYKPADNFPHNTTDVEELYEVYEELDEELGYFMERADEEGADLLVTSDHGTSVTDTLFFPNTWLHENGYLELSGEGRKAHSSRIMALASLLVSRGFRRPLEFGHRILNRFTGRSFKQSKHAVSDQVDWSESGAMGYLVGAPPTTGIMLNEDLLEEAELEDVREDIIRELEEEEAVEWVRPREEVYEGDRVEELPHLVVRGTDNVMMKSNVNPEPTVKYDNLGHGYYGIFGGYGPSFLSGADFEASIPDIAPTMLHILGREVPEDMDGQAVEEILSLGRGVERGGPIDREVEVPGDSEDEEIKERLEELGYVRD